MRLLDRLRSSDSGERMTIDDYAAQVASFMFNGMDYGLGGSFGYTQTLNGSPVEALPSSFAGFAQAYRTNGVVFACMLARLQVFSAVRFQFQQFNHGRPGKLFGNPRLGLLESPWVGGTTQDLLTRMIQDADLAGNNFFTTETPLTRLGGDGGEELVRLRPDWTSIVLARRHIRDAAGDARTLGYRRVGYAYQEDGGGDVAFLNAADVAHFAPIPDPEATYRGMSWLSPVIREIQTDGQMRDHKQKFFENGATPNLVVALDASITPEKFERFKALMDQEHVGVKNAYKTLFLGGGADVTVAGRDFKQIDMKKVQGAGETRIAAAAGVPPIIVGLSEGLESATYSNYGQARRRYADGTMHPLWGNAAGSLARVMQPELGSRLWYDHRDVPFLREDEKDAAEIRQKQAVTIRQLIDAGYEPDSVIDAVETGDFSLLRGNHTGLFSVQLQAPGTTFPPSQQGTPTPPQEAGQ